MAKKSKKKSKFRSAITVIAIILIIAFVALCYFYPPFYQKVKQLLGIDDGKPSNDIRVEGDTAYVTVLEDLKVHFVDVGQGDCIILELPDGKNVLIDAGEDKFDELDHYIKNSTSVDKFDFVILTHGDSDHVGNMDKVLQNYEVKYVYRPHVKYTGSKYSFDDSFNQGGSKNTKSSVAYGDFLNCLKNETYTENGETKQTGWEFFTHNSDFAGKISYQNEIYEYYFDFLTPRVESYTQINYANANDYSPILKFSYCGVDVMFTGDAEGGVAGDAEDEFVDFYKNVTDLDLDVDILKVSHHGSKTSTTQAFLDIVKPEHSVIQCGYDNEYDHPRQDTLDRLVSMGSSIFRNDTHGDILLTIKSSGTFTFTPQIINPDNVLVGGEILYGNT